MSKKYCLFSGHNYYPKGGSADFRAFGTIDELKVLYAANGKKWSSAVGGYPDPWGEIVDHKTMKAILRTDPYDEEKWEEPK